MEISRAQKLYSHLHLGKMRTKKVVALKFPIRVIVIPKISSANLRDSVNSELINLDLALKSSRKQPNKKFSFCKAWYVLISSLP